MLVRDRMEDDEVRMLDSVKDTDIVCVRGTYDHIHLVLEAIGVPFSHVSPVKLQTMQLKPEQTIYVNCPSSFPRDSALKLQDFVKAGGQLITTDWALKHVVEVAFPNTIMYSGTPTGDEVVEVEIVDKEDEVLKGMLLLFCCCCCIAYRSITISVIHSLLLYNSWKCVELEPLIFKLYYTFPHAGVASMLVVI